MVYGRPEPEPPRSRYIPPGPPAPQHQKFSPSEPISVPEKYLPPSHEYGPPPLSQQYGPPSLSQQYGPPSPIQEYGPPLPQKQITKNVYIHVPPEEPEEISASNPIPIQAPKKHYKIIFIKAPTPPTPTAPVIPEQQQDEHKTLVYVLVKKPEPAPQIVIPSAPPTEPSKPEVFFIKYKGGDKKPAQQYGPPGPY